MIGNPLQLSIEQACVMAVECWRILRSSHEGTVENYSARRIAEVLSALGITYADFAGQPYDPGLAPEVISTGLDDCLDPGRSRIDATVSPTVFYQGQVAQAGQISITIGPELPGNAQ